MKTKLLFIPMFSAVLMLLPFATACSHEVSHSESDKPGWFGGRTHEETTVYKNPDGTTTVEHEKEHSSNP